MSNKHLPLWIRLRTWDSLWKGNKTYERLKGSGAKQTLTPEQKTSLVTELAGYLEQLRGLQPPKEGFVGSLMLGSGYDHRLGDRRFGPFESIADFHKFVRRGDSMDLWAFDKDVTNVHNKSNSYVTKFTHVDMSPENIMEFAGWFLEYWEYTKMYFGWRPYREDFYHEMDKVLTTYPQELTVDKAILKAYDIWSYDIDRPRRSADEERWREWDMGMRSRIVQDGISGTSAEVLADVAGP